MPDAPADRRLLRACAWLTKRTTRASSPDEAGSTQNPTPAAIAESSTQQSNGLSEISTAMNRLDQVTQQNAAMFEETTAAVSALQAQAEVLETSSSAFRISNGSAKVVNEDRRLSA